MFVIAPGPEITPASDITAGHGSVPAAVSTSFPRGLMIAHIASKRAARFPLECGDGAGHEDERLGSGAISTARVAFYNWLHAPEAH